MRFRCVFQALLAAVDRMQFGGAGQQRTNFLRAWGDSSRRVNHGNDITNHPDTFARRRVTLLGGIGLTVAAISNAGHVRRSMLEGQLNHLKARVTLNVWRSS